jgi:hypothetical protein
VRVIRDRLSSMARPPSRCRATLLQVSNDHDMCRWWRTSPFIISMFITSVYMERIIMRSIFTCVVVWRPMHDRSSVHPRSSAVRHCMRNLSSTKLLILWPCVRRENFVVKYLKDATCLGHAKEYWSLYQNVIRDSTLKQLIFLIFSLSKKTTNL